MKTKLAKIFVCIMLTIVAACVSVACISDYPDKPSDIAVTITGEQDGKIKKTYDGSPLTVAYEGTEAVLTVTYAGSGETEYAESATAPVDAGTYVAKLSYAADSKFNAFEKTVELEIEKAANEFSFTVADIIVGQGTIAPVVEKNVSGGAVTYTYVGLDGTDYEESTEAPEEVGKYRATAVVAATRNYYGNRETYDFSIVTDDPLYGVPEEIATKANGLIRVNNFTLTESAGYKTNTANVKLSPAGVISANGDYIMIESDNLVHARTYVVVKSSTATNMYLRFAVKGNNTYEKIVNEPASGYKYFKALSVPEGYSILPVAFELSPGSRYVRRRRDRNLRFLSYRTRFGGRRSRIGYEQGRRQSRARIHTRCGKLHDEQRKRLHGKRRRRCRRRKPRVPRFRKIEKGLYAR